MSAPDNDHLAVREAAVATLTEWGEHKAAEHVRGLSDGDPLLRLLHDAGVANGLDEGAQELLRGMGYGPALDDALGTPDRVLGILVQAVENDTVNELSRALGAAPDNEHLGDDDG